MPCLTCKITKITCWGMEEEEARNVKVLGKFNSSLLIAETESNKKLRGFMRKFWI